MERIVLLRSCHPIAATSPCASPTVNDELHVTISVTSGNDIVSGVSSNLLGLGDNSSIGTSEPIAEDLLGVNNRAGYGLSAATIVHTIKVPLAEFGGRVIIEDVATSALFHPSNEVSIFCVLRNNNSNGAAGAGDDTSSAPPLFSSYTKVSNFLPTHHPDVQTVQHVGLRVVNESMGVCLTVAKAPSTTDRGIEGALATAHLECYHDHVVQWQLERALSTKNAAVDELIRSDILINDEIKRQRLVHEGESAAAVRSSSSLSYPHLGSGSGDSEDTVASLKTRIKELELERVKELESMRKLIAERRAEREAHIEARLKAQREGPTPLQSPLPSDRYGGASTASGLHQISTTAAATSAARSALRSTPQKSSASSRMGNTTPQRGQTPGSRTPTGPSSVSGSTTGVRVTTPNRNSSVSSSLLKSGSTPSGGLRGSTPTDRRSSLSTMPSAGSRTPTSTTHRVTSQGGVGSSSTVGTPSQSAIQKRADENLSRLRNSTALAGHTNNSMSSNTPSSSARLGLGSSTSVRHSSLSMSASAAAGLRHTSPTPAASRGVPPPPSEVRVSPMRSAGAVGLSGPGPVRSGSAAANTRRVLAETPTRSSTPPKAGATPSRSTPLRNNTQSLIRMARQP